MSLSRDETTLPRLLNKKQVAEARPRLVPHTLEMDTQGRISCGAHDRHTAHVAGSRGCRMDHHPTDAIL